MKNLIKIFAVVLVVAGFGSAAWAADVELREKAKDYVLSAGLSNEFVGSLYSSFHSNVDSVGVERKVYDNCTNKFVEIYLSKHPIKVSDSAADRIAAKIPDQKVLEGMKDYFSANRVTLSKVINQCMQKEAAKSGKVDEYSILKVDMKKCANMEEIKYMAEMGKLSQEWKKEYGFDPVYETTMIISEEAEKGTLVEYQDANKNSLSVFSELKLQPECKDLELKQPIKTSN